MSGNSQNKQTPPEGPYLRLGHEILLSEQWAWLSPRAVKCLMDLAGQFRGKNNGDLTIAFGVMKHRGWKSKSQLAMAGAELEASGWIVRTRQGGRHKPTLYALTFWPIHKCGGKLDTGLRTEGEPLHLWRTGCGPSKLNICPDSRGKVPRRWGNQPKSTQQLPRQ